MTAYQVLPPLSSSDFAALKADIAQRGVLVPIEYDEDGNVLDGHHRIKACAELGIRDWPRIIRKGLTEEGKRLHARQLNLARRHLNQTQKRELIASQLKETPQRSNRQIAADLQVNHETVQSVRAEQERRGGIRHVATRTDTKGREQPAERPPADPPKRKRGNRQVVLDPEFQAEAERAARDIEIERDERIALAGAGELAAENEKLTKQVSGLTRRISGLLEELASFKQQVKIWKERALGAGWKGRGNA